MASKRHKSAHQRVDPHINDSLLNSNLGKMSAPVSLSSSKRFVVPEDDGDSISSTSSTKISLHRNLDLNDKDKSSTIHGKKATTKEYSLQVKIIACLGLVFVQVFAAIVMKIAQKDGEYSFSPQSSLVMSESIKTIFSIIYLVMELSSSAKDDLVESSAATASTTTTTTTTAATTAAAAAATTTTTINHQNIQQAIKDQSSYLLIIHMLGLAGLYCINNAIMFWLFAHADPGTISLIKSGATIVSALLLYLWRRFRLSVSKWLILLIQMFGLIIAQYDSCQKKSIYSPIVYVMLMISLFNSSVANVWNEHAIKSFKFSGLAVKNIYLYSFGAVLNVFLFIFYRLSSPTTPSFFQGYNLPALGVVTSNACIGIAMNAVYKYADALIKNLATTTTTVVLLILSAWFFNGRDDIVVFLSAFIVICGTFLYFLLGISEVKMKELENKINANMKNSNSTNDK